MAKWTVWSLDVWGNSDDGYEVNDRREAGSIELDDEMADSEIVASLVARGFLRGDIDVDLDGGDSLIFVDDAKDSYPLLQLTSELT